MKKNNKLKIILLILLIILVIGITTINAWLLISSNKIKMDIEKQHIPNYYLKTNKIDNNNCFSVLKINALKELNYDSEIKEKEFDSTETPIPIKELEEKLEIHLLKMDNQKNNNINILKLEKVKNKVGSGYFYIRDAFNIKSNNKKKPKVTISLQFVTKYTETYKNGYEIYIGTDSNDLITTKYIKNLGTFVYFNYSKKNLLDDEIVAQIIVSFVYDDIAYTLEGNNMSRNMMIKVLESLK